MEGWGSDDDASMLGSDGSYDLGHDVEAPVLRQV